MADRKLGRLRIGITRILYANIVGKKTAPTIDTIGTIENWDTPAMNDRFDPERRRLFRASLPAAGVFAVASSAPTSSAPAPSPPTRSAQKGAANIADFGAKGDGQNDDGPALIAALAVAQVVSIPPGRYRVTRPITLRDGQTLQGAGKSGWEPYTGVGPPAAAPKTEILVDSGTAIDARNTNNATISGLSLRSSKAQQSRWAYEPGYQQDSIGIDITGSCHFSGHNISFHGFEKGVIAFSQERKTAQMPVITDWIAHDCNSVFHFSSSIDHNSVRDARIADCVAALHCGRIVEAYGCDGLRIENVRFFQCVRNALLIENTPFVSIVGATLFETGDETIVLRGCSAITMDGVQVVRAGLYHAPPRVQKTAILLENCRDFSFSGLIERPMGRAFSIHDCHNLSIHGNISTPFWSTGSLSNNDAAIFIERSRGIVIGSSFSGRDYWIAVGSDSDSAQSITGKIVIDGIAGVLRCVQLQPTPLGHVARSTMAQAIPPGGMVPVDSLRLPIPPQRTLVTRSVELTMSGALAQVGNHRLSMREGEIGGGCLSIERKILYRNNTDATHYTSVSLGIYNPTAQNAIVPAGVEIRISLAIE